MRRLKTLALLVTLPACFDFSAVPFGEKGLRCDIGSRCDTGLVCNAEDYCVDPCDDVRCSGHGACVQTNGLPTCVCDGGYALRELDCLEVGTLNAPCGPSSTCANGLTCRDGVCVDACALIDCGAHGVCQLAGTTAACVCEQGYHAANQSCVDDCYGAVCSGHGACSITGGEATCVCDAGYSPSGLACVADECVATGSTTIVCEAGNLYDVDSCERRVGVHESCGRRGCRDQSCNQLTWIGLGTSEHGPWAAFQDLSTAELSGLSRTSGFSWAPSVALDQESQPYVAWEDVQNNIAYAIVRRWSGAAWVGPDLGSGTDVLPGQDNREPAVVVNPSNSPLVAWRHDTSADPPMMYLRSWNGASWAELGSSGSGNGINPPDAAFDGLDVALLPNGYPVVTWSQQLFSNGKYNIYAKQWTGSVWAEIGTGSASGAGVSASSSNLSIEPSIAIDSSGRVSVTWREGNAVVVARYAEGTWSRLGTNVASSSGRPPKIAASPTGTLYVVFQRNAGGNNDEITARTWTGSAWADMGSDGNVSNTATRSWDPDIAVSPDGRVFVAWHEEMAGGGSTDTEVYVRTWSGSSWNEVATGSATGRGISNDSATSTLASIAANNERVCVGWQNQYVPSGGGTAQLEIFLRCAFR